LLAARWQLAALAVALLAAWRIGGLSAGFAAAMFTFVLATAALAPRRSVVANDANGSASEPGPQLERLSAVALAAAVPDAMVIFATDGATVHANQAAVTAFGSFVTGIPLQRKFRAPEMQELINTLLAGEAESSTVDYVERVPIERVY